MQRLCYGTERTDRERERMRFETISNTDLLKYALEGMKVANPTSEEEAYLLEEQVAEIEDTLASVTDKMTLSRVKRLTIGAKFGDWYYQKFEDRESACTVYTLYDSSGEYVNEFLGLSDMKKYIYRLYSTKGQN